MSYYVGLMSGTSADAIDAVLVDFSRSQPRLIHALNFSLPADYRHNVLFLSQSQEKVYPAQIAILDQQMAHLSAQAVQTLLQQSNTTAKDIIAIGSHGQTLYHQPPTTNNKYAYTWQIGDPSLIAYLTGITTVADFRRHDMAAGGQGAPLVPAFHQAVFAGKNYIILNIGGIANITVLSQDPNQAVIGFDTGVGNALMDAWCQQHRQQPLDNKGQWASSALPDTALLDRLLQDPYFHQAPPKSTGRDYFNLTWLQPYLDEDLSPAVVQATLCHLTVTSITQAIQPYTAEALLVCGGGVHNQHLMQLLSQQNPDLQVSSTATYGIDPDWMEAMCFAWLAKQRIEAKTANLPSVTGAEKTVLLGGIY